MNFLHQAEVFLPILLKGVHLTILVTVGSLLLSTALGLALVFMRVSGIFILSETARLLTNVLRGIPAIVQLFYVYFVFPEFGITLTALQAGIIGLGIAASPFQAENFRAGIEAVDKGQIEAALTIGMSWGVMMRRVILPQDSVPGSGVGNPIVAPLLA